MSQLQDLLKFELLESMSVNRVFWRKALLVFSILGITCSNFVSANAFVPNLTINELPQVLIRNQSVRLTGTVNGVCVNHRVNVNRNTNGKWKSLGSVASQSGKWRFDTSSPNSNGVVIFKVTCGGQYPATLVRPVVQGAPITPRGPGNRIFGLDISRWQHIPGKNINFADMAAAGASFVIIKASDGTRTEDAIARRYVLEDAHDAKIAGLIVGYYHMVSVPTNNSTETLVASAKRQASLAATRLNELGGYDNRTLPYTIDMEGINSNVTQSSLFIWTKTFIDNFVAKTDRTPIIYSYRSFLATRYAKKTSVRDYLRKSHLWLAQPGNPADPKVKVGGLTYGGNDCFHTAWTVSSCQSVWTFWQYTSRGNRDKLGIPWHPQKGKSCPSQAKLCSSGVGTGPLHLDLNVFNGTKQQLLGLTAGLWNRSPADYSDVSPTPSASQ